MYTLQLRFIDNDGNWKWGAINSATYRTQAEAMRFARTYVTSPDYPVASALVIKGTVATKILHRGSRGPAIWTPNKDCALPAGISPLA
jgi:hypothetical protein